MAKKMNKIYTIILSLLIGLSTYAKETKPNILFIFVDDFSPNVIKGTSQDRVLQTPNIDKLASNGTVFDNANLMGSYSDAVCMASRLGLNTGLSVWRAGQTSMVAKRMQDRANNGLMWSQLMKKAGYNTYMTGKWHVVNVSPQKVFDKAELVREGMPKDTKECYNRPLIGKTDPWDASDKKFGGYWQGEKHWTQENAELAMNYLKDYKSDDPFFMYVAFNAPHDPRQSPQKYLDMYPVEKMPVPENFMPDYDEREAADLIDMRDEDLAPHPRTKLAAQTHIREYYAIITHLDEYIGKLLETLEKTGKADNTIIIFSADNGLGMMEHGLLGKQNLYTHSQKVPLIIVGKDIQKNRHIKEAVYMQDIMPTTLEMAGQDVPEFIDYKSFLPLLKDNNAKSRYDSIYSAYQSIKTTLLCHQKSIEKDDMKLIYYPTIKKYKMFNLKDDPHQMNNLVNDKAYAKTLEELKELLIKKHNYYWAKITEK